MLASILFYLVEIIKTRIYTGSVCLLKTNLALKEEIMENRKKK